MSVLLMRHFCCCWEPRSLLLALLLLISAIIAVGIHDVAGVSAVANVLLLQAFLLMLISVQFLTIFSLCWNPTGAVTVPFVAAASILTAVDVHGWH